MNHDRNDRNWRAGLSGGQCFPRNGSDIREMPDRFPLSDRSASDPGQDEQADRGGRAGGADQNERRASNRIADQRQRPGQKDQDQHGKPYDAGDAVDQHGIDRAFPGAGIACQEPNARRIAADGRRQDLAEKYADKGEEHCAPRRDVRAAEFGDALPAQRNQHGLCPDDGQGGGEPNVIEAVKASAQRPEIDQSNREIEQCQRDRRLCSEQQVGAQSSH